MITSLSPFEGIQIAVYGFLTVFIMLSALMVIVTILGKTVGSMSKKEEVAPVAVAPVTEEKVEPKIDTTEYIGELQLYDVDEKTAACLMAIVSDTTGIPLSNLIFKKIKYLGEE